MKHQITRELASLINIQAFNFLISLEVKLAVNCFSALVYKFKSMRTIPVHVSITIRYATIREEEGYLVSGFRAKANKVPEHVSILKMCFWISLLGMNE